MSLKGRHRWTTSRKDRRSKRYREMTWQLAKEVYGARLPWWVRDHFAEAFK